ncbi:uncharacterized protein LOC108093578 [Drosophila ficusphila]|uniref:uncharacterized protein LOC108093578 n=1 Tax=Drosophila ficusphila TaxID=30025 RepID=UPI0007E82D65|nr:uncharacterized protein LOC108093578 [Drosophila ficusphila]
MTEKPKTDDSDSESENDEQLSQLLVATDSTLFTNAMFQEKHADSKRQAIKPVKSDRYLDEQETNRDLQTTNEMQNHIWKRLSDIIQKQIEFSPYKTDAVDKQELLLDKVRLVSDADCYLVADLVEEGPAIKPNFKRRFHKEKQYSPEDFNSIVVTGQSVLEGKDLFAWAVKKQRQNKIYQYRASGPKAAKLQNCLAIEITNEFTKQRRQNNWKEWKINKKNK